jgi:glycosyltransferase involved in cell wall biosynthesis
MIDVILPVLDERDAIPAVLASLPTGHRPVVVDNGSTDGSADIARSLGARVVTEPERGFGAAAFAGLCAAETEIVCFMDCDGSLDGADLPLVTAPLVEGGADLVIGARVTTGRGAWPLHARLGNRALASMACRRTGVRLHDLGPMRAARRDPLLALGLEDRRFGWPLEMVLRAALADWRVVGVDVLYHPRVGRSKVTGTLKGSVRTAADMRRIHRSLRPAAA